MQRLEKAGIHEFFEILDQEIDKDIDKDIEQPSIKFTLTAVGGTSLVLRDMKLATKDFDFMISDVSLSALKKYLAKIHEKTFFKVDIWDFPHVFSTTLPVDTGSDVYPKKYKHFDVRIINLVDNEVTKLSRFNEPDREDIDMIIKNGVRPLDIIKRFNEVSRSDGFPNKEEAKNKLTLFEKLYL